MSDSFDRSTIRQEILIFLSDFPEKVLHAQNHQTADFAVRLGNCLRAIAVPLERDEPLLMEPIGQTATTLHSLGHQMREAGLKTWDCGKIKDPVSLRLENVSLILEAMLGRLSAIEKRGAK